MAGEFRSRRFGPGLALPLGPAPPSGARKPNHGRLPRLPKESTELRARGGQAPLVHVGVPQSSRLFYVRPWVIDAIAERRRIGRDEAWRRFKACLEDREARRAGAVLDCDTL